MRHLGNLSRPLRVPCGCEAGRQCWLPAQSPRGACVAVGREEQLSCIGFPQPSKERTGIVDLWCQCCNYSVKTLKIFIKAAPTELTRL